MERHLRDGELLTLVDEGVSDGARRHLHACGRCMEAFEELHEASARVRDWLAEMPLPPDFPSAAALMRRRPSAQAPWMRAAAVVAIVLLPMAFIMPVRVLVGAWLGRAWSVASGVPEIRDAPRLPAAPVRAPGYTVWFTPSGPELDVVVASSQASGTLVVAPARGMEGAIHVDASGGEGVLVSDGSVAIRNGAESLASYRIEVPTTVVSVRVRVGGSWEVERAMASCGGGCSVALR